MRQAINENPVAQAAVIGLLVIAVAFLFMTRVMSGGGSEEPAASEPSTTASEAGAPADSPQGQAGVDEAGAAIQAGDAAGAVDAVNEAANAAGVTGIPAAPSVEFEAGKGLPQPIVSAHESGNAVALLITKRAGIEDKRLRAMMSRLESVPRVTAFHTRAHDIARYSQITNGVSVSRVPALVVVHPVKRGEAGPPEATVSYGFRGPESAEQALRDALYSGRDDIPYHPE